MVFGLVTLMGIAHGATGQVPGVGTNGIFQTIYTAHCPKCSEKVGSIEVGIRGGRTDNEGGTWEQRQVTFRSKCGYMFEGQLPELHVPKVVVDELRIPLVLSNSPAYYMKAGLPYPLMPPPPAPPGDAATLLNEIRGLHQEIQDWRQSVQGLIARLDKLEQKQQKK